MRLRCVSWSVIVVLVLVMALAACGGDEPNSDAPAPGEAPTGTAMVVTMTLPPERTLPPTWTPEPSLTPLPDRPTLEITRERPTATSFTLPTLTPSATAVEALPSSDAASAAEPAESGRIELVLSEAAISEALANAMSPAVGVYFGAAPTVALGSGWLRIEVPLWTTPGDASSERMIAVETDILVNDGRVEVNLWRVYLEDTGADYFTDLSDDMVAEIQDQIDRWLTAQVGPDVPFAVVDAVVSAGQITFQLQRLDAAPTS